MNGGECWPHCWAGEGEEGTVGAWQGRGVALGAWLRIGAEVEGREGQRKCGDDRGGWGAAGALVARRHWDCSLENEK